ncbi:avidin/streptavidin family protein [Methylorubrum thiocyanatum]|uniref:Membrane protein n=1 Tax=Methylorubrum thiocyanatum TaxID=47958 RepID=A0AA40S4M7_9HYPH|nr:avidin/streptavidin family protein [Methylorubrum thiocyanatum]MBA8914197.1 putative membrane protein [Methylorubrum thiocyanatum]
MFEGRWRNECGAEIHLLQYGEAISGTYTPSRAELVAPCRGRILVGSAEGELIGFVTSSSAPGTVTSWTGRLLQTPDLTKPEIHLVYHVVERVTNDLDISRSKEVRSAVFCKYE